MLFIGKFKQPDCALRSQSNFEWATLGLRLGAVFWPVQTLASKREPPFPGMKQDGLARRFSLSESLEIEPFIRVLYVSTTRGAMGNGFECASCIIQNGPPVGKRQI